MPDESQGFLGEGSPGEGAFKVSLVPKISVVCSDDMHRSAGGSILELNEFSQTTDQIKQTTQSDDVNTLQGNNSTTNRNDVILNASNVTVGIQSGLKESQVSVQVGVVKTAQAPEPLKANSLLKGAGMTPQSCSSQTNGCNDSDYSSTKSSPGHASTSFSTELCDETLSDFNGSSFETTNPDPSLDSSHKTTRNSSNNSKTDSIVKPKTANAVSGSSPSLPEVSSQVAQTRNSIDVRWMQEENRDEDRRSTKSGRSVKEGVYCCYQAVHRAFLQCVEETPAMVSGLVLSLAFCVAVIIVICTTGRVRNSVCVCVCL